MSLESEAIKESLESVWEVIKELMESESEAIKDSLELELLQFY